jgi:hypothetical protein
MSVNSEFDLPSLFTTFDELDGIFDCPSQWKSLTFTPDVTWTLMALHRLVGGWMMISGSAVVAETMLRSEVNWNTVFKPGDIDVYVHTGHLKTNKYYNPSDAESVADNIKLFIGTLIKKCRRRHDIELRDVTKLKLFKPDGDRLHYTYGFSRTLRMNAMFEFKVKDISVSNVGDRDRVSPVKIQLMFVAPAPTAVCTSSLATDVRSWQKQILKHYDINVCRCVFDIHKRTVSCPTDPDISDFLDRKQFVYDFQRNNRNSGERIAKYIERGFKLVGFYDRDSHIAVSCGNTKLRRDVKEPSDFLLRPVDQRKRPRPSGSN